MKIKLKREHLQKYTLLLLFLMAQFLFFKLDLSAQSVEEGEKLFNANCTSCHGINEKLIGPALNGVTKRREEAWLIKWIKNSQAVIKSGDTYAVNLFNEYNQNVMNSFENLSDKELKSVLAYISAASEAKPAAAAAEMTASGGEMTAAEQPATSKSFKTMLLVVGFLVLIVVVLVLEIIALMGRLTGKTLFSWTKINAVLMIVFVVVGLAAAAWEFMVHGKLILPEAASEHGTKIDSLMSITLLLTGIVFVVTQVLLFYYSFKYRRKEDRKAYYFPHSNKLEIIWTLVPAVALTVLVLGGFKNWSAITAKAPEGTPEIEIFGYQFAWKARYPGADNKLGNSNFNYISNSNPLGVAIREQVEPMIKELEGEIVELHTQISDLPEKLADLTAQMAGLSEGKDYNRLKEEIQFYKNGEKKAELEESIRMKEAQIGRLKLALAAPADSSSFTEAALDDIVTSEVHIPVGKPINLKFRGRDVIHSAYLPHFRVQMNVVPGLPTNFHFTPTVTTEEMRKKTGNDKFDYHLVCAKICGAAHFNMKLKFVVESEEDYNKWLKEQKPTFAKKEVVEEVKATETESAETSK